MSSVIVCGTLWKPKLEAASATRLVSVPPSAPIAAVVTNPLSAVRRLILARASSSSGRLRERFEPMSSPSVTVIGFVLLV